MAPAYSLPNLMALANSALPTERTLYLVGMVVEVSPIGLFKLGVCLFLSFWLQVPLIRFTWTCASFLVGRTPSGPEEEKGLEKWQDISRTTDTGNPFLPLTHSHLLPSSFHPINQPPHQHKHL